MPKGQLCTVSLEKHLLFFGQNINAKTIFDSVSPHGIRPLYYFQRARAKLEAFCVWNIFLVELFASGAK